MSNADKLHSLHPALCAFRTCWFHSLHRLPNDWRGLNQSYRLWMLHAKPLDANWTAWCHVQRALSRFLWLQGLLRGPLRLGTKCDGKAEQAQIEHVLYPGLEVNS